MNDSRERWEKETGWEERQFYYKNPKGEIVELWKYWKVYSEWLEAENAELKKKHKDAVKKIEAELLKNIDVALNAKGTIGYNLARYIKQTIKKHSKY